MMPKLESGHGPRAPIEKGLAELADIILKKEVQKISMCPLHFRVAYIKWRHN